MNQGKKDVLLGVILVFGFSIVVLVLIPVAVEVPRSIKIAATAPDYWPKLVSSAIALLGVAVLTQGILKIKSARLQPATDGSDEGGPQGKSAFFKTTAAVLGLLAYYWLVVPLGIVAASMLALPGFAVIYGERRIKVLIPLSLLLPVALYFFFTKIANIPMPLGIFA